MSKSYFKIIRPFNVLITFISIGIGALVSGNFHWSSKLLYAGLTAAFITAGANVINDIFDVEIDRINRPDRALPSGKISISAAKIYFTVLYLSALFFAALCGKILFLIALVIALALYWYSASLKRTALWGNVLVSAVSGFTFIYGAMSVGGWKGGIVPALLAFFFHLGREMLKDMQDVEGDIAVNAVTFAGKYGLRRAALLTRFVFIVLIFVSIAPFFLKIYNEIYLIIVIFGVDSILLYIVFVLKNVVNTEKLGKLSNLLKLDMLVGLLAIYLGL